MKFDIYRFGKSCLTKTVSGSQDLSVRAAVGDGVIPFTIETIPVTETGTFVFVAAHVGTTMIPHFDTAAIIWVPTAADKIVFDVGLTARRTIFALEAPPLDNKQATSLDASCSVHGVFFFGTFHKLFAVGDLLGPNTVTGLVPMPPSSVEPLGQTTITFTDSTGTVRFPFVFVVHWPVPPVTATDITLFVILFGTWLILEFESVFPLIGDTFLVITVESSSHFLFGTSITEPQVLASFVYHIDWTTFAGDKRVSAFRQAPATVETVSGDTLVFRLEPSD